MLENSERIDFVLHILREYAIEEEQSLFNCVAGQGGIQIPGDFGDGMENLRDPFSDSEGESDATSKKSMNGKYRQLKSSRNRPRIKSPDFLVANETDELEVGADFAAEMINFMDSIGLEAYKAAKQLEAEQLELELRKSKSKKKPVAPKPKIQDDGDVESLTDFSKLAEMHERPKGFPITGKNYNILNDPDQLEWLQRKSVPSWNSREDSKRKCVKWLKEKT